jgi:hypothetical protein
MGLLCEQCQRHTPLRRALRAPERIVLFCHHCRAVLLDRATGPRRDLGRARRLTGAKP